MRVTDGAINQQAENQIVESNLFGDASPGDLDSDTASIVVGTKFKYLGSDGVSLEISGIRWFRTDEFTGVSDIALWEGTTNLASATVTGETADGWQRQLFSSPVTITEGTIYTASALYTAGSYRSTDGFHTDMIFTADGMMEIVSTSDSANGVYSYSGSMVVPATSAEGKGFFVDIIYPTSYVSLGEPVPTAPIVVSNSTAQSTGTSHLVSLPNAIVGDLIIIFASSDGGSETPDISDMSWTLLGTFSGTDSCGAVFMKSADGSEGGTTVDITTPSSVYLATQCYCIQLWSGWTFDIIIATATSGSDASVEVPIITTGFDTFPSLCICAFTTSRAGTLSDYPEAYVPTANGTAGTDFAQLYTAYSAIATDPESPGTFTLSSNDNWGAVTVAIRGTIA